MDWQALSPTCINLRASGACGVILSSEVRQERGNEAAGPPSAIALVVPDTQLPAKGASRGRNPTCLQTRLCPPRGRDLMG